eukprot:Awhi_evm2s14606
MAGLLLGTSNADFVRVPCMLNGEETGYISYSAEEDGSVAYFLKGNHPVTDEPLFSEYCSGVIDMSSRGFTEVLGTSTITIVLDADRFGGEEEPYLKLDLSNNKLRFTRDMYLGNSEFTEIVYDGNKLDFDNAIMYERNFFPDFKKLKTISISDTEMSSLPLEFLQGSNMPQITLKLNVNPYFNLIPGIFSNVTLKALELRKTVSYNSRSSCDGPFDLAAVLEGLTVSSLILSDNGLKTVPSFKNIDGLSTVDLTKNSIVSIEEDLFPESIENIYLQENDIVVVIPAGRFVNLPNLSNLDFSSNRFLKTIEPLAFQNLTLNRLWFEVTGLETLERTSFDNLVTTYQFL